MTQEEEWQELREENAALKAQVAELLPLKEQVEQLKEQVKQLRSQLAKDRHNSHLPPSSDRSARKKKPRSLRKTSGKKPGGQAERDLRMIKVQQKVSCCFRTPVGAQIFCRIRSYLSSLRKQGFHLFPALQQTFLGHPLLPALQES